MSERSRLHDAIAEYTPDITEATGGAVLTGWVVIAEWMDADGKRYLSNCIAENTTPWTARGMMHDVLFGGEWD